MPAVAELARSQPVPSIRGDGVRDPLHLSPAVAMPRAAAPKTARSSRSAHVADPYTAELELLQRAQAAYTQRDFPEALALVGEHTRRFPKGHLAEERDALRVRSLVGMGRAGEAKSAATNFAAQFPRSVLLPRLREQARVAE